MIFWIVPIAGFALLAWNEIANPRGAISGKVLWRGDRRGVALTFDDGPHPGYTPGILDLLDRYQAKATFFVIGRHLEKYGHLMVRACQAGHLVGNHSYHHYRTMSFLSPKKIREEIVQCQREVEARVGYQPRFYRQPAGFRNPRIFGILKDLGMTLVGWQARAFDTQRQDVRTIAAAILKKTRPGGVILLHDGSDAANDNRTPTLQALPVVIRGLQDRGLEFYTLDKLFGLSKEVPKPDGQSEHREGQD